MFPSALCDALSNLHNDAPAHPWDFTQLQVESSLDIPQGSLLKVFKTFDELPLASGSIAQVHRAELHSGEVIAAKVRHPRVSQLIEMDFRLMALAAAAVGWVPSMRTVKDSVYQFSHAMAAQAHLNIEGHHLEVLNYNFRNWDSVRFPQPFYASSSVILETFEEGRIVTGILDEFDAKARCMNLQGSDVIPVDEAKFIVTTGVSMYLKMLLLDNLMVSSNQMQSVLCARILSQWASLFSYFNIMLIIAPMFPSSLTLRTPARGFASREHHAS